MNQVSCSTHIERSAIGGGGKPRLKHVWGGTSKHGAAGVAIFTGIMTATRYTQILDLTLLPFTREVFPKGFRFQENQALCPLHKSIL